MSLHELIERLHVGATLAEVQAAELPAGKKSSLRVPFLLVTMWLRTDLEVPESGQGRIVGTTPSGELFSKDDYQINLEESHTWRMRIRYPALPISDGPGRYWFENQVQEGSGGWSTVAKVSIEVTFNDEAEPSDGDAE